MERRRYHRWDSDGKQVRLLVPGRRTQRCKVRTISRAALFIETDTLLPEGTPVELAFTLLHTRQLVKLFRRSAYVARSSDNGLAVLFFNKRTA
jgi:hypothetical protein